MLAGCGQRGPIVPLRPPAGAMAVRPATPSVPPSVQDAGGEQPVVMPQEQRAR